MYPLDDDTIGVRLIGRNATYLAHIGVDSLVRGPAASQSPEFCLDHLLDLAMEVAIEDGAFAPADMQALDYVLLMPKPCREPHFA